MLCACLKNDKESLKFVGIWKGVRKDDHECKECRAAARQTMETRHRSWTGQPRHLPSAGEKAFRDNPGLISWYFTPHGTLIPDGPWPIWCHVKRERQDQRSRQTTNSTTHQEKHGQIAKLFNTQSLCSSNHPRERQRQGRDVKPLDMHPTEAVHLHMLSPTDWFSKADAKLSNDFIW